MEYQAHVELLRDILSSEISDTFKEIYGCRPRFYNFKEAPIAYLMEESEVLYGQAIDEYQENLEYQKAEEIRMSNLRLELNSIPKNTTLGDALKSALNS